MTQMLAERTAAGMDGMVEENVLNVQGWDFDLGKIELPIELHHGALDNVAPAAGADLLSQKLPQAKLWVYDDMGHYQHIKGWPWMIARAAGRDIAPWSEVYDIPES